MGCFEIALNFVFYFMFFYVFFIWWEVYSLQLGTCGGVKTTLYPDP